VFLQTISEVQEQNRAAPRLVDGVVRGITNQLAYRDYVCNAVIAEVLEVPHRYCAFSPHTASVTAPSLYEAAALGVDERRRG
jgi:hypothetical protein